MAALWMVLLLVHDVARELGLSDDGVRYLQKTGQLQALARTPGGVRLFRPEDVAALKKKRAATRKAASAKTV